MAKMGLSDKHYDKQALKGLFYIRGYDGYISHAADYLKVNDRTAAYKINNGVLSHEDTILLCHGLEMTPREYINIFMKDVFDLDK